jgi:hypothetical protein
VLAFPASAAALGLTETGQPGAARSRASEQ